MSPQPVSSSAPQLGHALAESLAKDRYELIVVNVACPDMVAHTGNISATVEAIAIVDAEIGKIVDTVLSKKGVAIITADHGNAEEVTNLQTGKMDKEHSTNPVPFLIIAHTYKGQAGPTGDPPDGDLSLMHPVGVLADVAPTMLKILGVEKPKEMTGRALI